MLSEWEAWDVIAARFLKPYGIHESLCAAAESLERRSRITRETSERMRKRIATYLGRKTFAYTVQTRSSYVSAVFGGTTRYFVDTDNDTSRVAREARAMAALWLAMDAAWEESEHAIDDFRRATDRHGAPWVV